MSCNYHISDLKPFIYLVKDIVYTNDRVIGGTSYKLEGQVTWSETESINEIYKFISKVQVNTNWFDDSFIKNNKFSIIVETQTDQYLVNPEYLAVYSSEFNADNDSSTFTLTFDIQQNIPAMKITNELASDLIRLKECKYDSGVSKLYLDNELIQYNTISYKKVYDGFNESLELTFTSPFIDLIKKKRFNAEIVIDQITFKETDLLSLYERSNDDVTIKLTNTYTYKKQEVSKTPIIRYVVDGYICDGLNKCEKLVKEIYQGQWIKTSEYKKGQILERNSKDCGYTPEKIYRWIELDINEHYMCENNNKYYSEQQQYSEDEGITWIDTQIYRTGRLYQVNVIGCDYSMIDWIPEGYICEEDISNEYWVELDDEYICKEV